MRLPIQLILAICLISFLGCAKNVRSNYDPLAILPATATWEWEDAKNVLPSHPSMEALQIDRLMRDVVGGALSDRGYTEAEQGSDAEYQLNYEIGLGVRVGKNQTPAIATASIELTEIGSGRRVWVAS
jgi:hypothetical protein